MAALQRWPGRGAELWIDALFYRGGIFAIRLGLRRVGLRRGTAPGMECGHYRNRHDHAPPIHSPNEQAIACWKAPLRSFFLFPPPSHLILLQLCEVQEEGLERVEVDFRRILGRLPARLSP